MQVIDYTEKAIAVIGDTKLFKDTLSSLKGKFNPSLRDPNNKENKIAGWIFPKTKKDEIEKVISDANSGKIQASSSVSADDDKKKNIISKAFSSTSTSSNENEFKITKEMYLALITRIEKLESENGILLSKLGIIDKKEIETKNVEQTRKINIKCKEESDDESDEEPPKKGLLPRRVERK
jgi:hypothetical protein